MTQTTPSHTQAVEAAVDTQWRIARDAFLETDDKIESIQDAWRRVYERVAESVRAELTSQQEVAAPVGGLEKYMQGNYPNAKGETLEARVIYALEEMDVALGMKSAEECRAASRVPVVSLASREQGVEAVGAVPDHGQLDPRTATEHARQCLSFLRAFDGEKFSPTFDNIDRRHLAIALDHLEEAAAMVLNLAERVTAPPSSKTQAEPNKAPAPVPVVQGEAECQGTLTECPTCKNQLDKCVLFATPANMAVGAVGGVGAVPGWMNYSSRVGALTVDGVGLHMRDRRFTITDMRQGAAFTLPHGEYDLYAYPAGEPPAQFATPAAAPKRDREADRQRFPDAAFNHWLDSSITENGEFSVWDQIPDVCCAWHGWINREHYAHNPTTAAEQVEANPDHLGSGASGGVPTDAERDSFHFAGGERDRVQVPPSDVDFGDYVYIEQHRYGVPNEMYVHKVIGRLESNSWIDVPAIVHNGPTRHDTSEPIVNVICCGVCEDTVLRYRVADIHSAYRAAILSSTVGRLE